MIVEEIDGRCKVEVKVSVSCSVIEFGMDRRDWFNNQAFISDFVRFMPKELYLQVLICLYTSRAMASVPQSCPSSSHHPFYHYALS